MAIIYSSSINFNLFGLNTGDIVIIDSDVTINVYHPDDIILASNITFIFIGGKIISTDRLKIIGNDTILKAPRTQIFGSTIKIEGSWNINEAYPEWFGAIAYDTKETSEDNNAQNYHPINSSSAINKAIKMKSTGDVSFANGIYVIDNSIEVTCGIRLVGVPGMGISEETDNKANGTIFRIKRLFPIMTVYSHVIGANAKIIYAQDPLTMEIKASVTWAWEYPQAPTTIENIILYNFETDKLSNEIPIGILFAGGINIINVSFINVPKAVQSTHQNYSDGKNIKQCFYSNECRPSDYNDLPFAFNLSRLGDALNFSNNVIKENDGYNKGLLLDTTHGATISCNTINADVKMINAKGTSFLGNNFEGGMQIAIIHSQVSFNSNYIERGLRPAVVILSGEYNEIATATFNDNLFVLRGPKRDSTTGNGSTQNESYLNYNKYDLVIDEKSMLTINNNFRNYEVFESNQEKSIVLNPTGIIIGTVNANASNFNDDTPITALEDFNADSYMLSFSSTILRAKVIDKNYDIPDINSETNFIGVSIKINKAIWFGDSGSYIYAYQILWDKGRRILGCRNGVTFFQLNSAINMIHETWRVVSFNVLSIIPLPIRVYRKKISSPSISPLPYDVYVDIPSAAGIELIDNGLDVSGYRWERMTSSILPTPVFNSIVEMHKIGDNVVCTANNLNPEGNLIPLDNGWKNGDKISRIDSSVTKIL